jgi:Flp pilus assembly protein TadG
VLSNIKHAIRPRPTGTGLRKFLDDENGTTAVEFGLVALPFLMMIFGTANTGLYYFTVNSLDRGVEDAARLIRTGEAQKAGKTVADFKQLVCDGAGGMIDCAKVTVQLQSAADWPTINKQSCLTAGNITGDTGVGTDKLQSYVGGAGVPVLISVCYVWGMTEYLPFLKLSNVSGGMLLQSSTAFRTEPYI